MKKGIWILGIIVLAGLLGYGFYEYYNSEESGDGSRDAPYEVLPEGQQ